MLMLIFTVSVFAICLIVLLNRDYIGILHSYQRSSILGHYSLFSSIKVNTRSKYFFHALGKACSILIPKKIINRLESYNGYLARDAEELYVSIGQACFSAGAFALAYFFNHNFIFLILFILAPGFIIAEIPISVAKQKINLDNQIPHIVECLKILIINTETPLNTSLELICRGLAPFMQESKKELLRMLKKAEKIGMNTTLKNWQTDSHNFKDFLSLLIAIHNGVSKNALKITIDNYLARVRERDQDELKNKSENLQLYLMGPVILMLLVILHPMMASINYVMELTGIK